MVILVPQVTDHGRIECCTLRRRDCSNSMEELCHGAIIQKTLNYQPSTEHNSPQSGIMKKRPMEYSKEMHTKAINGLRIDGLNELKTRLGQCETIVCLGNGPSCEDPRLADYQEATLFRVNWIWTQRGWFAAPDMVFTADPDLVQLPRQPIVAFPTMAIGEPILRNGAANGHRLEAGYSYLDRFTPSLANFSKPRIPTNGALMIAMAAALRPRRLVVSGIDLYRHPEGKYPGADDNAEGYTSQHCAETDLELIGRAIADHDGDIIILSDNLHSALPKL